MRKINNFTKTLFLRAKVPNTYGTRLYIVRCTLSNVVHCTLYSVGGNWTIMLTIINGISKWYALHWISVRGSIRVPFLIVSIVQCTLYTVQCTLYNTHNNKWNSYRPAHWDSMNCVPLRNPIYYCEYYVSISAKRYICIR